ncbi:MAG: HAMP domain-containing histidine kinase [Candidatus Dormibacteraeota bacterium]|nr:HAMP domain-containing histidine kinase [Candidatus Dormibacteraeota bacterium]
MRAPPWTWRLVGWLAAVGGPVVLTAALVRMGSIRREYIFLYLGLVAVLGVLRGLWPAAAAAAVSFLLVDYFFVNPQQTLTMADEQDIANLLAFMATGVGLGLIGSQRRRALLHAEALTRELRRANAELVQLQKEQAAAAQAALTLARNQEQIRALQEVDRARRELLANVSHELRTPLGTILTLSTAPAPAADGRADAGRRLDTIAGEVKRLKALVDDMLDLAVLEAGTLELRLEPVRLADAVEASVERLQRTSPERRVDWDSTAAGVDVLADWDRLLQVLDNLLANADRFGPPASPIEVEVGQDGPGLIAVTVCDHGPGVAEEVRPRLFERFVHAPGDEVSGRPAGTGLGLAIVKGLVEAHAGTVALVDGDGVGACFRFTLPLAEDGT